MTRFVLCVVGALSIGVISGLPAAAEGPTRENLTGQWSWTSYLLNPASRTPGTPLSSSTATIWASAVLDLRENPVEGDADPISGTLTFMPSKLTLKVNGRRVKGEGESEEFFFRGEGERPGQNGGPAVKMVYEIRGGVSSPWPKDGPELSLRGYIRNVEGDPFAPKATGAFVLIPAESSGETP